MMNLWYKHYPEGYLRRDLQCSEFRVDATHTVMIMLHNGNYDSYVMEKDPDEPLGTPFIYMFGTPFGEMRYSDIVNMTIRNAPDYYHLLEEGA